MTEVFRNELASRPDDPRTTLYWSLDRIYDGPRRSWEETASLAQEAKTEALKLGLSTEEVNETEHQVLSDRVAVTEN